MALQTGVQQFQYEVQDYQEECVENIVDIFEKLQLSNDFEEVMNQHHENFGYSFPVQDTKNIDIMMETGTGKTFTFIKTIFELSKNFGYKKFIILIPSVPIREGTKTNLEDTKDYFKSLYANEREKQIEAFVYESGNISAIRQFISTSHLSVLIMTPSSFSHKDNILNRPLEQEINTPDLFINNEETPKSYLECLQRLNPIVIMDEPHRFEGDAFKKYFEGFTNYYLRFGATYPNKKNSLVLSNVAYVLDSISSFRQSLVKKIVVYTQDIIEDQDTLVGIKKVGSRNMAIVNSLINGIVVKRELGVGSSFNGKSIKRVNKNNLVFVDDSIERVDYSLSDESLRKMIQQTIKIHFDKEKELFKKNIKALTLFFMESDTNLFRGDDPKVKLIFEEEYIKQYKEQLKILDPNSDYYKYLLQDFSVEGELQVHKGYFSGDKGNADEKVRSGVEEILKEKKKLLSFNSPTRFIFSIWALQEGWDNPNVFTICKLSNQGSEISKLQQIGRGLRICVDQNLERKTLKNLQNNQVKFWQINNLDVVVSSKEQGFVESIQKEILNNSFLIPEIFTEQDLKILLKEKGEFDDATVRKLYRTMEDSEMIVFKFTIDGLDVLEKSADFLSILKEQDLPEAQVKTLESIFATDTNAYVEAAKNQRSDKNIYIKPTHLKEFEKLWATINKNSFYVLESLTDEQEIQLVENIKSKIEENIADVSDILLQTTREELDINKIGEEDAISKKSISAISYSRKIDYIQLAKEVSDRTKTPISFIIKIINSLSKKSKNIFLSNPAQVQKEMIETVKNGLLDILKAKVHYDGIDGTGLPNVFKKDKGKPYLDKGSVGRFQKDIENEFSLKSKWVFEEVIEYDSNFELEIIEKDPDIDEIKIFGKLPRLNIKTPIGDYNPDFCYVIKNDQGNTLFLIVEAKGYDASAKVKDGEKGKIVFARKYFETLSEFYKDENIKISYKERINKIELRDLIGEL